MSISADVDQQRYVQSTLTSAGVASMDVPADNASLGDSLHIKDEISVIDNHPIMPKCMYSLYGTKQQKMVVGRQESTVNDYNNDEVPTNRVKEEIHEDKCSDYDRDKQATSTCAFVSETNAATNSVEQNELLFKEEPVDADLDIGPTVLQHMDSHYRNKQADLNTLKQENTLVSLDQIGILPGTGVDPIPRSYEKDKPVKSSLKDISYRCDKCLMTCVSKWMLKKHLVESHGTGVVHKCPKCDREFKFRPNLMTHMGNKHSKYRYKCVVCQREYRHSQSMNRHILKYHSNSDISYKCKKCLKTYKTAREFRKHVQGFHGTGVSHRCHKCNMEFKIKHSLTRHIQNVHNTQQYECNICNKLYKSMDMLKTHVLRHHSHKQPALDDQQLGSDTATSTILGSVDEAASGAEQSEGLAIKREPRDTDLDIGPTVLQHMDSHYTLNQAKLEQLKMEGSLPTDEQIVKIEVDSSIKEDIVGV